MTTHQYLFQADGLLIPKELETYFINTYNETHKTRYTDFYDLSISSVYLMNENPLFVDVYDDAKFSGQQSFDSHYINGSLIIPLSRQPKQDELLDDINNELNRYLPENFDYSKHIGLFTMTYHD